MWVVYSANFDGCQSICRGSFEQKLWSQNACTSCQVEMPTQTTANKSVPGFVATEKLEHIIGLNVKSCAMFIDKYKSFLAR
jgi:hypothetical protein